MSTERYELLHTDNVRVNTTQLPSAVAAREFRVADEGWPRLQLRTRMLRPR